MNTKNTRSSPKKLDDERRQPKTKDPEIKSAVILGILGIVAALITSPLWVPLLGKHSDIRNSHTSIQHTLAEETKVEFSPITLQSYLKQIGDPNLTDLQREKFLQEHLGRRVEWDGYIRQVAKGVDLPEREYIVCITPTLDFSTDLVKCWFPSKFKVDLLSLKENQKVIISGILEKQDVLGPVLKNCEIRKVMDGG